MKDILMCGRGGGGGLEGRGAEEEEDRRGNNGVLFSGLSKVLCCDYNGACSKHTKSIKRCLEREQERERGVF